MNDQEFMDKWYAGLSESRKAGLERFHQHHLETRKCFGKMFHVKVDDDGQIYTDAEWANRQLAKGGEPKRES